MPLPLATINLGFSIASGVIKLGGRIDQAIAENTAQTRGIVLPQRNIIETQSPNQMKRILTRIVRDHDELTGSGLPAASDFSHRDRSVIVDMIGEPDAPSRTVRQADLISLMERYAGDELTFWANSPDELTNYAVGLLDDSVIEESEVAKLVYYLGPGADNREQGLGWQLGMAIAAGVAEVGLANKEWLVKDPSIRRVAAAVLGRLVEDDMLTTANGRALAGKLLGATLNGALDAKAELDQNNPYLEALLNALSDARASVPDHEQDDYLIGLVRGQGYTRLISELLEEGGSRLGADSRAPLQQVIAGVLQEAKTLVDSGNLRRSTFDRHWPDLVRAALRSVHRSGPVLLAEQNALVREALLAAIDNLATGNDPELLSGEGFLGAVEAAISAVAAKPELLGSGDRGQWLQAFYTPFAAMVGDSGLRRVFVADNLENMVRGVAEQIAAQPDLVYGAAGLPQEMTGEILSRVAAADTLRLDGLAQAAIDGALDAVAKNPTLLHRDNGGQASPYALIAADLAGSLAEKVRDGKVSRQEAESLARDGLRSLGQHGQVLLKNEHPVVQTVFASTIDALSGGLPFTGFPEVAACVAETTIVALAGRDDLVNDASRQAYVTAFLNPFAGIVKNDGLRAVFTDDGLQQLLASVAGHLAKRPELLVGGNQLPQAVIEKMLGEIAATGAIHVRALAEAGVEGLMVALSEHPGLLKDIAPAQPHSFADVVAAIAKGLALRVKSGGLAGLDAASIMRVAVEAVRSNPALPEHLQSQLAGKIIERVLDAADGNRNVLLRGAAIVSVVQSALRAASRHAVLLSVDRDGNAVGSATIAEFLFGIVDEGLKQAARDLGRRLDLNSVPLIIGLLIDRWAAGEIPVISNKDKKFKALWEQLAGELRQQALQG